MGKREDLTGMRFGRLTVISCYGHNKCGHLTWLCRCDCGVEKVCVGYYLTQGETKSCGCLKKDTKPTLKHGNSGTRLYNIWSLMRNRCKNTRDFAYQYYGARGISVCEAWENYTVFKEWAVNNGYQNNLSIDRIDVNGNYCPENCRWVDMKTQSRNRRNNHYIEYKGETHTIADWADILGIEYSILQARLVRYNWTTERVFSTPINPNKSRPRDGRNTR